MNLTVRVKPECRKGPLVRVLAAHFGVPRSAVSITRGHTSRVKLVRID